METPKIKRPHEVAEMPRAIYLYERGELTPSEVQKIATKAITQDRASLHTSLVAAVEGKRIKTKIGDFESTALNLEKLYFNKGLDAALTIINSIFKE